MCAGDARGQVAGDSPASAGHGTWSCGSAVVHLSADGRLRQPRRRLGVFALSSHRRRHAAAPRSGTQSSAAGHRARPAQERRQPIQGRVPPRRHLREKGQGRRRGLEVEGQAGADVAAWSRRRGVDVRRVQRQGGTGSDVIAV